MFTSELHPQSFWSLYSCCETSFLPWNCTLAGFHYFQAFSRLCSPLCCFWYLCMRMTSAGHRMMEHVEYGMQGIPNFLRGYMSHGLQILLQVISYFVETANSLILFFLLRTFYVPWTHLFTGRSCAPGAGSAPQNHQIFCCAFNANGTVFVTGSSDTLARVPTTNLTLIFLLWPKIPYILSTNLEIRLNFQIYTSIRSHDQIPVQKLCDGMNEAKIETVPLAWMSSLGQIKP